MKVTTVHLENPVMIHSPGWIPEKGRKPLRTCSVANECNDILFKGTHSACEEWCEKNGCAPIPTDWKGWHSNEGGYPKDFYEMAPTFDALMVIAADPQIRAHLTKTDPMALKQVETALGNLKPTKKSHPQTFSAPEFKIIGKGLYANHDLLGEWDNGKFVPSRLLLEKPTKFQKLADKFVRSL